MSPLDPTFIDPVTINILIVGDGRIRFDDFPFGLSLMIEALQEKVGPIVRFLTTTAYRQSLTLEARKGNGEGSDFGDFRFDDESFPKKYDAVWIFGDQEESLDENCKPLIRTTQLTDNEQKRLLEFMEKGGGIFATGDHGSLGASINAHIPRVRTMRTWHDGPSPELLERDRNDTRDKPDTSAEENEIPQKITPSIYRAQNSPAYPHPLLCGSRGTISVLPDHMHEGECKERLGEVGLKEYPEDIRPLVIAESRSFLQPPRRLPSSHRFAAIGAYDGHLANVGRVVVDASFHHFVNINLQGFFRPTEIQDGKPVGADTGVCAYEDIKSYYRNIAIWLAPPEKQREMYLRALWEIRWRSRVSALATKIEEIRAGAIDPEQNPVAVLDIGKKARIALDRLSSSCFTLLWSIETFKRLTGDNSPFSALYPWMRENQLDSPADLTVTDGEKIIEYVIGGIMIAMVSRFLNKPTETISNLPEKLEEVLRSGLEIGLKAFEKSKPQ